MRSYTETQSNIKLISSSNDYTSDNRTAIALEQLLVIGKQVV